MTLPDLDIRTWIILALSAALLIAVLSVPALRQNVATWLVWLGTLLGAGAHEGAARERQRKEGGPPPFDAPDPEDYERPPIASEDDSPTPDEGPEVDTDYWESLEEK